MLGCTTCCVVRGLGRQRRMTCKQACVTSWHWLIVCSFLSSACPSPLCAVCRLHDFFVQQGWIVSGPATGGKDQRQQQWQSPGG